ncbi:S-adenosylmethionine:tRNA ribosyltransferase-isomerase [Desulfosarcina ovata subsp. sediminis]|uniref:S-adenosylmethionine:tRNA ribosyltransferase-isomerase n=1 Tax=Desulfosarcina ovata subsp. sediminis TaxID=885957 RepID=A0A5K7ZTN2_9BACT|nr:tRNA preQ1(34) S-adenosylmethionine ribosyltransferase-isomerase QueA [Desulfosarcina ovata]BBO83586.1 S-adenosylmethionine:tRNA ribosyltransferase-isomerase [Desulfosarcina ovata subsp. sediminis]
MYALHDYDYHLPERLIAQNPAAQRDGSRLLHLCRNDGTLAHRQFHDLVDLLAPSDILVVNDTRVVPGRLHGRKETGGKAELLILDYGEPAFAEGDDERRVYHCLIKASKQAAAGTRIYFAEGLVAEVQDFADGIYTVAFSAPGSFDDLLGRIGRMPLPPYIKRDAADPDDADRRRYQTVYAKAQGAIAAPTAGLHFTDTILNRIREKGVTITPVTLHVGYGTFVPVRVGDIRDHRMHEEWFSISTETARQVNQAKDEGRRVVAVGTTSVRTLEYAARENGRLLPGSGRCDLFIYPGYTFRIIDAMITNFHLPKSTLLMLVSAFAGRKTMLQAYAEAVREKYRFFSYGDAMMIE